MRNSPSTPRRTRKALLQGYPTKGGARKKNKPTIGGACDNDDSADDSSDDSPNSPGSDDDIEIIDWYS